MIRIAGLVLLIALSGCSDDAATTAGEDPSKLSAELEAEARAIEQRADAAVADAEKLANGELQALRAEAAADSAAAAGSATSNTAAAAPENSQQ